MGDGKVIRDAAKAGVNYKDVWHEVLPDKEPPYFLGDIVELKVKLTNMLDQPRIMKFVYSVRLPEGMSVNTSIHEVKLEPGGKEIITLPQPLYLHFLGVFRVVVLTGIAEQDHIDGRDKVHTSPFLSIFAEYSRDREGYEVQKKLEKLNGRLFWLTTALFAVTVLWVALTIAYWLGLF